MPDFTVECEICGNDLDATWMHRSSGMYVKAAPCERCVEKSHDEGYEKGKIDGIEEAGK